MNFYVERNHWNDGRYMAFERAGAKMKSQAFLRLAKSASPKDVWRLISVLWRLELLEEEEKTLERELRSVSKQIKSLERQIGRMARRI